MCARCFTFGNVTFTFGVLFVALFARLILPWSIEAGAIEGTAYEQERTIALWFFIYVSAFWAAGALFGACVHRLCRSSRRGRPE